MICYVPIVVLWFYVSFGKDIYYQKSEDYFSGGRGTRPRGSPERHLSFLEGEIWSVLWKGQHFRFDRKLLGLLSSCAYDAVREMMVVLAIMEK